MKKLIAIIAGGDSSEWVVSLKSAAGISSFIDKGRYDSRLVLIKKDEWVVTFPDDSSTPIDRNDFSFNDCGGIKRKFDFAYITIHGTPGEDGLLQGYFDLIGIKYSSCGVLASAISNDKFTCNNFLRGRGISTAESFCIASAGETASIDTGAIKFPVIVKPNKGGSSFGTTKVNSADELNAAISKAGKECDEVLVEQYHQGMEVTCGCYRKDSRTIILPITEVISHNEIFDYDAKYNGQSEEITPARIPDNLARTISITTERVYDELKAKGLIRVDYIITESGHPILIDVNTTPGMTPTSFIPQQVKAAGLTMTEVLTDIIENELNKD
jgi:D-alanine-D-alanine ligase